MNPSENENAQKTGTLYLVATPIGNLEDITHRALRVLQEADAVYCEDTRRTLILFQHFKVQPKDRLKSFHDHSARAVVGEIKRLLEQGLSVAYATDGGMPVVSDPGFVLVRAANEIGANVQVVPGPSAAVMLFAASGLESPKYLFHGFFPRTRGEVERTLEIVKTLPVVHLFYEAPGRVIQALEILKRNVPAAQAAIGRELTKLHEEVLRGSISKLYDALASREKVRGECVIAVMGGAPRPERFEAAQINSADLGEGLENAEMGSELARRGVGLSTEQQQEILAAVKSGLSSKDAAKQLSKKFGVSRKIIYEFIIRHLT